MESREIFHQFAGNQCPGCNRSKLKMRGFCVDCYRQLPTALKHSLWKRFGAGYEEAHQACLSWFRLNPVNSQRELGFEETIKL